MSIPKIIRHPADRRTLVWSLVFFPLVPAWGLSCPDALLGLLPLSIYLAFCAGVLTHYHNHRRVFALPLLNKCYDVWLSAFYGFPIFSWVPTHNQNHHKYVNGPGDATSTNRRGRKDTFFEALSYPIRSSAWQAPALMTYWQRMRARNSSAIQWAKAQVLGVLFYQLAACFVAVQLHGFRQGGLLYLGLFFMPALFAPWSMMFINYLQHVGCDSASTNDHSRNFVGRFENWLVFDAGLHTVHHEHPGVHFSEYREIHAERSMSIDPVLNQRNVFFFLIEHYLFRRLCGRSLCSRTEVSLK